jgi:hypothetical protein
VNHERNKKAYLEIFEGLSPQDKQIFDAALVGAVWVACPPEAFAEALQSAARTLANYQQMRQARVRDGKECPDCTAPWPPLYINLNCQTCCEKFPAKAGRAH